MAGEKIPEDGEAEKISIEDEVSTVSKDKATFSEPRVIICDACGKGLLRWWRGGVDVEPTWEVSSSGLHDGICGGALIMISRNTAIEIADRFEKIGAEAWLRGKRRP